MVKTACIGFCRNNKTNELFSAVNSYLNKEIGEDELLLIGKKVRKENWMVQKERKIDIISSNDFTYYDNVLDMTCLLGNIQRRFFWEGGRIPLDIYFTMAHGQQKDKFDVHPLEVQNWLNTNYLYFVPEFVDPIEFAYSDNKPIVEFLEAKSYGITTRSIILSPISYLLLGKSKEPDIKPLDLLDELLPIYKELFLNYERIGVKDVQIDEPLIGTDLDRDTQKKIVKCYNELKDYAGDIKLHFVSYYSDIHENFDLINSLPVDSIHIDVNTNYDALNEYASKLQDKVVSLGIVDATGVWKNNLNISIDIVSKFCDKVGSDNVIIAPSSSLFLCPYSVKLEKNLPNDLSKYLSFSVEKLEELNIIKTAINQGKQKVSEELKENEKIVQNCRNNLLKSKDKDIAEVLKHIKKNKNAHNVWKDFSKNYKLKTPSAMLTGENEYFLNDKNLQDNWYKMQDKAGLDVVSCSIMKKNYDISVFDKQIDNVVVLKNSFVPRFGKDYYPITIIYDIPKVKTGICKKVISNAKKETKKPIKFSICSPLHYLKFSHISPCLNETNVKSAIINGFVSNINEIAQDIDILQINDMTFSTGIELKASKNIQQVREFCYELNDFFSKLKDIKCLSLYSAYVYFNDIIEELCRLNIDILFTESARSGHEIMSSFISYKPTTCIGIGVFDTMDNRVPTKNEMYSAGKKALMCFDADQIILTGDGDFYFNKDKADILASFKILTTVASDLGDNW